MEEKKIDGGRVGKREQGTKGAKSDEPVDADRWYAHLA